MSDQGKFKDAEPPMRDAIVCFEKVMEQLTGGDADVHSGIEIMLSCSIKPALRTCQLDIARACNGALLTQGIHAMPV